MSIAICPVCGAWLTFDLVIGRESLRHEMPCQRCGSIFKLGDNPDVRRPRARLVSSMSFIAPEHRTSYFNYWRNFHDRLPCR